MYIDFNANSGPELWACAPAIAHARTTNGAENIQIQF